MRGAIVLAFALAGCGGSSTTFVEVPAPGVDSGADKGADNAMNAMTTISPDSSTDPPSIVVGKPDTGADAAPVGSAPSSTATSSPPTTSATSDPPPPTQDAGADAGSYPIVCGGNGIDGATICVHGGPPLTCNGVTCATACLVGSIAQCNPSGGACACCAGGTCI